MKPQDATVIIDLTLKEGNFHNVTTTVKVKSTGVVVDISGHTFVINLLDKQGGTILDTITGSLVTDGTDGKYNEAFTIADLDVLIVAGTFPGFWEGFVSSDGTAGNYKEWWRGKVTVQRKGSA